MTRTPAIHAQKVKNFAHNTLKALGFVNLSLLFKRQDRLPATFTTELPGFAADVGTGLAVSPLLARPQTQTQKPLQISIEDWDILFRAIQLRLRAAVGEQIASQPPPQADDTAGRIQVVVLECVSAMEELHAALAHERMNANSASNSSM